MLDGYNRSKENEFFLIFTGCFSWRKLRNCLKISVLEYSNLDFEFMGKQDTNKIHIILELNMTGILVQWKRNFLSYIF